MEQFLTFVSQHWVLAGGFVIVLLLILLNEWREKKLGIPRLAPQQAIQWMNHQHAAVIDLRGEAEFHQGHITGAVNIPYRSLGESEKKLQRYKEKPVILACKAGQQSVMAGNSLRKQGFTQLAILAGGMNAWVGDNLPLVDAKKKK